MSTNLEQLLTFMTLKSVHQSSTHLEQLLSLLRSCEVLRNWLLHFCDISFLAPYLTGERPFIAAIFALVLF